MARALLFVVLFLSMSFSKASPISAASDESNDNEGPTSDVVPSQPEEEKPECELLDGTTLKAGQSSHPPGRCVEYFCDDSGEMERNTCEWPELGPECHLEWASGEDVQYPDCCPKVVCD